MVIVLKRFSMFNYIRNESRHVYKSATHSRATIFYKGPIVFIDLILQAPEVLVIAQNRFKE